MPPTMSPPEDAQYLRIVATKDHEHDGRQMKAGTVIFDQIPRKRLGTFTGKVNADCCQVEKTTVERAKKGASQNPGESVDHGEKLADAERTIERLQRDLDDAGAAVKRMRQADEHALLAVAIKLMGGDQLEALPAIGKKGAATLDEWADGILSEHQEVAGEWLEIGDHTDGKQADDDQADG